MHKTAHYLLSKAQVMSRRMSIKRLERETGSIVDDTVVVSIENIEAVALRVLEDLVDCVLEGGFSSPFEALDYLKTIQDVPIEEHWGTRYFGQGPEEIGSRFIDILLDAEDDEIERRQYFIENYSNFQKA